MDSIDCQTNDGVEYVLVDGSADHSPTQELCSNYGELSPQIINQVPQGVYAAMNAGLNRARGRFVFFLNAGDTFHSPRVLWDLRQFIAKHDPVWLYADVQYIDRFERKRLAPNFDYAREKARNFRAGRYPLHPATFVRTKTLKQIGGFNLSMKIAADYKASLILSQIADPLHWPHVAVDFALGGISSRYWIVSHIEALQARCEVFELSSWERVWDLASSMPLYARGIISRVLGRV